MNNEEVEKELIKILRGVASDWTIIPKISIQTAIRRINKLILQREQQKLSLERQRVKEKLRKKKKKGAVEYGEQIIEQYYNQALDDVLDILKEE